MKRVAPDCGFTFVELVVASSISTVIMAGLLTGAIALQRGYSSARYRLECQEDQLRVMDTITRDLHRAVSVTISNQNRRLTLSVPDQVDTANSILRTPGIVNGEVRYGSTPMTVAYYVSGTAFIRQEGTVETTLCLNPSGLESFLVYQDDADMKPASLRMAISFVPTLSRRGPAAAGAAVRCSSVVRLRNEANVLVQ